LAMIKEDLVLSAQDCSKGGLAVALAEGCILSQKGAIVNIEEDIRKDALAFGETQSRILISVSPANKGRIEEMCKKFNTKCNCIGQVKGDRLKINDFINLSLSDAARAYKRAIPDIVES